MSIWQTDDGRTGGAGNSASCPAIRIYNFISIRARIVGYSRTTVERVATLLVLS